MSSNLENPDEIETEASTVVHELNLDADYPWSGQVAEFPPDNPVVESLRWFAGLGATYDELDWDAVRAAARLAEEQVDQVAVEKVVRRDLAELRGRGGDGGV